MSFDISIAKTRGERIFQFSVLTDRRLIAIVGPSGIGKTTILNCIAGLLHPDHGHMVIGGTTLFDTERNIVLPPDKRGCGYVFQDSRLFPHLNVRDNLVYGAKHIKDAALRETVEMLDVADLLDRRPAALSGGEVRRVAIGRALLSDPAFLLFDEPLGSLDPQRTEPILQTIEHLRDQLDIPMIYVSHARAEIDRLTDFVVALDMPQSASTLQH